MIESQLGRGDVIHIVLAHGVVMVCVQEIALLLSPYLFMGVLTVLAPCTVLLHLLLMTLSLS